MLVVSKSSVLTVKPRNLCPGTTIPVQRWRQENIMNLGLEDAAAEMARMEEVEAARKEQEKLSGREEEKDRTTRKMFRVV